jgi:hypothetical protein
MMLTSGFIEIRQSVLQLFSFFVISWNSVVNNSCIWYWSRLLCICKRTDRQTHFLLIWWQTDRHTLFCMRYFCAKCKKHSKLWTCDMIWYDMIWYMIWCDVMWCDVIWYDMIYQISHNVSGLCASLLLSRFTSCTQWICLIETILNFNCVDDISFCVCFLQINLLSVIFVVLKLNSTCVASLPLQCFACGVCMAFNQT